MTQKDIDLLIKKAANARKNALVPVSNVRHGAAVLCSSGEIYAGCNIETEFPTAMCAERVALYKALSEGERDFSAIALVADPGRLPTPCGRCRQFINEVTKGKNIKIYMTSEGSDKIEETTLHDLLPRAYLKENF